jgi:hypothetical protein
MYSEEEKNKKQQYYSNNKEKIKESRKQYYEENKEQIFRYKKEYRENHREKAREYAKQYRSQKPKANKLKPEEPGVVIKKKKEKIKASNIGQVEKQNLKNKECQKRRIRKYKINALEKIAKYNNSNVECWRCGETRMWVLTIGHIMGNGRDDRKKNGTGTQYYKKIIDGSRTCEDLKIECITCNYVQGRCGKYPDELLKRKTTLTNGNKEMAYKKISAHTKGSVKCWKCGESLFEALTIGHINNDGKNERTLTFDLRKFYKDICNGTRDIMDLRVECYNCNLCREWYGKYPEDIVEEEFIYIYKE